MKTISSILLLFISAISFFTFSQDVDSTQIWIDDIEHSLNYQEGTVHIKECNATIKVPNGYGYLDKEQANYVLVDLWGNPKDDSVLGMLVKKKYGVLGDHSFAFIVEFQDIGYVEDNDAKKIDYKDLLKDMKEETKEDNRMRKMQGYPTVDLIGWASSPYYDSNKKILHWAKELYFEGEETNTLNYNLRVLGRRGVLSLNAVASIEDLAIVKGDIQSIINNVSFDSGSKYSDFNSKTDNVAAWTVGGLVAGKVLAKTGLFAVIAKFGKFIAIAVGGIFITLWKRIRGRKEEEQAQNTPISSRPNTTPDDQTNSESENV